jgi:Zn-dependent peptidase ImmA (M78 family)
MKTRVFLTLDVALRAVPSGAEVHAIRQFNFMNHEQPASVGRLLGALGFGFKFENLPDAVSGRLDPDTWSAKGFEVVVNAKHPRTRQRFTALHEVGHYYLHKPERDFLTVSKHRASFDSFDHAYGHIERGEESEANAWVDAVVFGHNALEGALSLYGRDVVSLARHFGFSIEVIERALMSRGL